MKRNHLLKLDKISRTKENLNNIAKSNENSVKKFQNIENNNISLSTNANNIKINIQW